MKIVVFAVCALTVAGAAPAVFALAARTTYTYGAFRQFGVTTDETIATPGR